MDDRMTKFNETIKNNTSLDQDLKDALQGFILDSQDDEKKVEAFHHLLDKIFGKDTVDFDLADLDGFDPVNIPDMYEDFLTETQDSDTVKIEK